MTTAHVRTLATQVRDTIIAAGLYTPPNNTPIDTAIAIVDYLPRYTAEQLADTKIAIAPRSQDTTWLSRQSRRREITIQIAVMQAATPNTTLWESLIDLAADIDESLANANFAAATASVNRIGSWLSSTRDLYDIADAEHNGVFRSVITATFAVYA
jgi:hypothetical protein